MLSSDHKFYASIFWFFCAVGVTSIGADIPPSANVSTDPCPKYIAIIKKEGMPTCAGSLVTDMMIMTSCECVCNSIERGGTRFTIRQAISSLTVKILRTESEVEVDMIVPHPLCEINEDDMPKFGTALMKTAARIPIDQDKVVPITLYSLLVHSEIVRFAELLSMPSVKCSFGIKPYADIVSGSPENTKCRYPFTVEAQVNAKLLSPRQCVEECRRSKGSCIDDLEDYDLHCMKVLDRGTFDTTDPITGMPLMCEGRAWGLMHQFNSSVNLAQLYYFYGINSILEIQSMAVTFSVGNDCGGNRIVIKKLGTKHNRKASKALTVLPLPEIALLAIIKTVSHIHY